VRDIRIEWFMPETVTLLAPGFLADKAKFDLTSALSHGFAVSRFRDGDGNSRRTLQRRAAARHYRRRP
jgi:hypothetical protein